MQKCRAYITFGQLINAAPKLKSDLSNLNNLSSTPIQYTAVQANIALNNNDTVAILDSGAAVSILSHDMAKKIGCNIGKNSITSITSINSDKQQSLGIAKNVTVEANGCKSSVNFVVMNQPPTPVLLGINWFHSVNGILDFKKSQLTIEFNNSKTIIPISIAKYTKNIYSCRTRQTSMPKRVTKTNFYQIRRRFISIYKY